MTFLLFFLAGSLIGQAVYWLPYWVFLRGDPVVNEQEAAAVGKPWLANVPGAILVAGFVSFAPVFFTTRMDKPLNALILPAFFFIWMSMFCGILEVMTGASALIATGRSSRRPGGFVLGPKVRQAGACRIVLAICAAVAFFGLR